MADLSAFYEKKLQKNHAGAGEVMVHYDPSVVGKRNNQLTIDEKARYGLSALGAESNDRKQTNKVQLEVAIKKERVKTLQEAMSETGLSRSTIITYLGELGLKLYDERTKKHVGKSGNKLENRVVYYDGDPLAGGKKI